MNDRKFTVRKSRKSTKKGGPGKNDKAAKDDTFGGYQVDPVEESNQKIALIMNELMQAEEQKSEVEEEGKTDLDTTFAFEDKVNNEEFKDLIAKTKAIMEEVEEEDEYDEEDDHEPNDSEDGEENISDEDTPQI